jgi:RND family efflux transporter MFP subunit
MVAVGSSVRERAPILRACAISDRCGAAGIQFLKTGASLPASMNFRRSHSSQSERATPEPTVKRPFLSIALPLACFAAIASCDSSHEHGTGSHEHSTDDHSHGESSAPAAAEIDPATATVVGERVLLFMEYPHLVRGGAARFLAHLTVLETGEPVRSGRLTLTIGATKLVAEGPKREGLFTPEGSLPSAGRMPTSLSIESDQVSETLDLGEFVVHENDDGARHAADAAASDPPADSVPFLLEQQWKLKLLLAEAQPRALTRRLVVPANVRTPEGSEAVVTPPLAGRLLPPDEGKLVTTGERVESGRVLGFIEPPLGASDLAQLRALELELDVRALDASRTRSEAHARLDFSQREHARLAQLREHQLSTQQELDEAERNLRVARGDIESANAMKAALDRLLAERSARTGGSPGFAMRLPLLSPLAGTVVAATKLQGASVEPGEVIFRVLDTSRVWIEGRVSEFDLHLLGESPTAVATFAALPERRVEIGASGGTGALSLLPVLDPESRTAVLRCEVANAGGSLKAGMLAELEIAVAKVNAAVAIPVEAILIDQGLPTAYVMLEGELFQKRELELGVKDGDRVEVLRGITAGERVATRGAYLVKLAALSPQSFGAGHQH